MGNKKGKQKRNNQGKNGLGEIVKEENDKSSSQDENNLGGKL